MSSHFVVTGGKPLNGTIRISGEKNSVLPMLSATVLTNEVCTLRDVPDISDVRRFVEALSFIGAEINWDKTTKVLTICCKNISAKKVEACTSLGTTRANIVLAGALLARFGEVKMVMPGGDAIGHRPLDMHLEGLEHFGVEILEAAELLHLKWNGKKLKNTQMILSEASVTGTETLVVFLAAQAEQAQLCFAAADPQVQATLIMLQDMGVQIEGIGTHKITMTGAKELTGTDQVVSPDVTVAGTYAIAAAITNGDVTLENVPHEHMYSFYGTIKRLGVNYQINGDSLRIFPPHNFKAIRVIKPNIYPGLCPDLQSPISVLLTQCEGTTQLFEWMYEGRLGHLWELKKMGANIKILNLHQAEITGKKQMHGRVVQSWDLRAGAAMVLAGLVAEGQTTVQDIHWIDRGYENFALTLEKLGADIKRIED